MSPVPSFSVVIPNHARVAPVVHAVRSALVNAPASLEVIVVDDASPNRADIELALAAIGDSRIRFVALGDKGTASRARNAGVAAATGDWIAFLDSDDRFEPGKWEALEHAAAKHPDADVLHDRAHVVVDGRITDTVPHRAMHRDERVGDFLFAHGELLSTCTLTIRRALLTQVPWRPGLPRHQDYQLVLDLEAAGATFVHITSVGTTVQWSTGTRPADKGESAAYSLGWLESVRPQLSTAAFRRAAFRFGIVKLLESGRRLDAVQSAARLRAIPDVRAALVALALCLAPAPVRQLGYRVYKRVLQPQRRGQRVCEPRPAHPQLA